MDKPKAICWDMDGTLGLFDSVQLLMEGTSVPPDMEKVVRPLSIRYKLREALQELRGMGIVHYVTTSAPKEIADAAVSMAGISGFFEGIFGNGTVNGIGGRCKRYMPVAEDLGYSMEEAVANMVVVGDGVADKPSDLDGLVFILQPSGAYHDAFVPMEIVKKLLEAGKGHFKRGFDFLYETANQEERNRRVDLGNGIKFDVNYTSRTFEDFMGELVVPTITCLPAEGYRMKPEVITFINKRRKH